MSRTTTASWFHAAAARPAPSFKLHLTPKLILDVFVAGAALLFLAPLLLLVALAIKLESKGPVFFSQVRYGWDNRPCPSC